MLPTDMIKHIMLQYCLKHSAERYMYIHPTPISSLKISVLFPKKHWKILNCHKMMVSSGYLPYKYLPTFLFSFPKIVLRTKKVQSNFCVRSHFRVNGYSIHWQCILISPTLYGKRSILVSCSAVFIISLAFPWKSFVYISIPFLKIFC